MSSLLIKILEKSCEKNGGDTPVTLGHLLNILKLEERLKEEQAGVQEKYEDAILTEVLHDTWGDRDDW